MSEKVFLEKCSSCDSGNADNKSNEDALLKAKGSTAKRAVNAWIVKMEKIPDSKTLVAGSGRHRFIFVYYCDIRLFLPVSEAVKKVEALNAKFTEPLFEEELYEIIERVDQRHEYDSSVFHFNTMLEYLPLTREECHEFGFFDSYDKIKKYRENQENSVARDKEIAKLWDERYSHAKISRMLAGKYKYVSVDTVKNVTKKLGLTKERNTDFASLNFQERYQRTKNSNEASTDNI